MLFFVVWKKCVGEVPDLIKTYTLIYEMIQNLEDGQLNTDTIPEDLKKLVIESRANNENI